MIDRVVLLVRIAIRNLLASPINLLIGGLIMLGTLVFVLLGGLLDSLNQSMQRSVVGSLAGHVQIYSAASKDELALFGQMGNFPDLPAMGSYPKIQQALSEIENVKMVVPMGISAAIVTSGNIVDRTLEGLRNLYKARDGQPTDPKLEGLPKEELETRIAAEVSHMRQIIKVLRGDMEKAMKDMLDAKSVEPQNV
ncbi:MAG TPA: ABC transporter permease, partial [Archangium sp.]